jgi:hypothetical protein
MQTKMALPKLLFALLTISLFGCSIMGNGEKKEYYPSGNLKTIYPLKRGLRHGEAISYYDSIVRVKGGEMNFEKDTSNGPFAVYYPDGQVRRKGQIQKKKLHGLIESFHRNGKLKSSISYLNGEVDGRWFEKDSTGNYTGLGEASVGDLIGFNVLSDTAFFEYQGQVYPLKFGTAMNDYFVWSILENQQPLLYYQSNINAKCTVMHGGHTDDGRCVFKDLNEKWIYLDNNGEKQNAPDSLVYREELESGQNVKISEDACPFLYIEAKHGRWKMEWVYEL